MYRFFFVSFFGKTLVASSSPLPLSPYTPGELKITMLPIIAGRHSFSLFPPYDSWEEKKNNKKLWQIARNRLVIYHWTRVWFFFPLFFFLLLRVLSFLYNAYVLPTSARPRIHRRRRLVISLFWHARPATVAGQPYTCKVFIMRAGQTTRCTSGPSDFFTVKTYKKKIIIFKTHTPML